MLLVTCTALPHQLLVACTPVALPHRHLAFRDFDCQLDAYRNYCCKKCKKFFTLNTFTVRDEMKSLMHKQALYNFFTDAGVLVPPKAEARKAVDDEDEDE
jgi:hypothetical protein